MPFTTFVVVVAAALAAFGGTASAAKAHERAGWSKLGRSFAATVAYNRAAESARNIWHLQDTQIEAPESECSRRGPNTVVCWVTAKLYYPSYGLSIPPVVERTDVGVVGWYRGHFKAALLEEWVLQPTEEVAAPPEHPNCEGEPLRIVGGICYPKEEA
jgi:hypothetical protein